MEKTENSPYESRLFALVRRHGLASYVSMAYGISWLCWLPYVLSLNGLGVLNLRFPYLEGFGQLLGLLPGGYLGPLTSAFVVTAVIDGRAGLQVWRSRLVRWRIGWRWYAFALIGIPALLFLGTLPIPGALSGLHRPAAGLLLTYVLMMVVQLATTGIAEEPGWRDFALPRLQQRYGPLRGTLILAPVWVGWHIPLFVTSWADGVGGRDSLRVFVLFAVVGVFLSIIITWVFNHSKESLPLAMMVHCSNNNFLSVFWGVIFPRLGVGGVLTASIVGYGACGVLLAVMTRGRLGYLRPPSPACDAASRPSKAAGDPRPTGS